MTRLKELRCKRGYTQIKMQQLTGIAQSYYSKLENGKGTDPAYDDIPNGGICAKIDVSIRIMGGGVSHSSGYLIKKGGNNYTISGSGLSGGKVKMAKNGLTISGISGGSGKYTLTERYRS